MPLTAPPTTPPKDKTSPALWRAGTLTYTTGGLVILFLWLLWGDFAWAMKDRAIPPIMQLLLKQFNASDMMTGLLLGSLPPAIGLILGPIISYRSDRHRGRWGRRIPFLLIPTPFAVAGILGLAFSPVLGAQVHGWLGTISPGLNTCVLVSLGIFWMLFEVATIIANSVFGALINDVVPQPLLGRFFGLFRALSLIAAIIFNFGVLGKAETTYVWICIGIGALYGIGFTLMCLKVKEGEYPDVVPMDAGKNVKGAWQTVRSYFQECFGNPYYRWVFIACAVSGLATGPVNLFSYFFAKSLGMSLETYAFCLGLTYCISLVLAYPTGWLADRIHPLRLAIGILALYAFVTFCGGLFATDARLMAIALVAHGIVAGGWATATASLSQRLLPKAEFAQFASAGGIIANISWMLLAPACGFVLDRLHHDYRHTYFMGFALAIAGLTGLVVLHGKFMKLGGPANYVAPE